MVRRAGPVCPAAGMHRKPHNRLARSDRVGRGLAPAAGMSLPGCTGFQWYHIPNWELAYFPEIKPAALFGEKLNFVPKTIGNDKIT